MKIKQDHIQKLSNIENSIIMNINRCSKEVHIPIWQIRIWSGDIRDARKYLQRTIKRKKK